MSRDLGDDTGVYCVELLVPPLIHQGVADYIYHYTELTDPKYTFFTSNQHVPGREHTDRPCLRIDKIDQQDRPFSFVLFTKTFT